MKNYHALGIIVAATVIFVSVCSMAIAAEQRPTICPTPTQQNSGYIVTDEDGDGKSDTVWHVYTHGICAGWTIGVDDHGTPL